MKNWATVPSKCWGQSRDPIPETYAGFGAWLVEVVGLLHWHKSALARHQELREPQLHYILII